MEKSTITIQDQEVLVTLLRLRGGRRILYVDPDGEDLRFAFQEGEWVFTDPVPMPLIPAFLPFGITLQALLCLLNDHT